MTFNAFSLDIPTPGTQLQFSSATGAPHNDARVKLIRVQGNAVNTAAVYFGDSNVGTGRGWRLNPGQDVVLEFGEGAVPFSVFWGDADVSGDDLNVVVITT